MEQQRIEYRHISDHPLFKVVGMILTMAVFAVSYFLFMFVLGVEDYLLISLIFPCLMIVVWESIKHRHFWLVWFLGAAVCFAILPFVHASVTATMIVVSSYWGLSLVVCFWLILACSRAEFRAREREKEGRVGEVSIDDPVKDAFLARLFNE